MAKELLFGEKPLIGREKISATRFVPESLIDYHFSIKINRSERNGTWPCFHKLTSRGGSPTFYNVIIIYYFFFLLQ